MKKLLVRARRKGFTLVEMLVTTIVIGVLAAVVVPALTRQTTAADPTRVASDLNSVASALDAFNANVRYFPKYLDDLTNTVSTSDPVLGGATNYGSNELARWSGPYLKTTIPLSNNTDGDAITTGFSGVIQNQIGRCSSTSGTVTCSDAGTSGDYVAIRITGLTSSDFDKINYVVDGPGDAGSTTGRLRYNASSTTYFLATPFTN